VTKLKANGKSFPEQLAETGAVSNTPAFEPYVPPEVVADFLAVERRQVLAWARADRIPAHPLGHGKRRVWRFRLSEVNAAVLSNRNEKENRLATGSPRSQKEHSHG
jgi:Helix-turn-helix domain